MRITIRDAVKVDLLSGTDEIAEVAKFAAKLGYDMELKVSEDHQGAHQAILSRSEPYWLGEELAFLTFLQALGSNETPRRVLEHVSKRLEALHAELDVIPMDGRGIGGGHMDGDEHD